MAVHVGIFIHFFIMFSSIISANGATTFLVYNEPDYAGDPSYCNGDQGDGCAVSEVISIKMLVGSCGQIEDSNSGNLFYIKENIPDTDYKYEGQLRSCPIQQNTVLCPKETFVKQIEWDSKFNLTKGIKLSCNKPESNSSSEAKIIFSHQKSTFSGTEEIACAAFEELTIARNMSLEADANLLIEKDCKAGYKEIVDKMSKCPPLTALSGMSCLIETETNYIKSLDLICNDVPNIAASCKPEDRKQLLSVSSTNSTTKKVGVGQASSMSESEEIEFSFYTQFGLEIGFPLSTNFKDNIGKSGETGYDWRSAPKTTWENEQNVTIKIETSAACKTEIYEIVGKCSYMNIRPYHLERVDHCSRSSFTTIEQIPHNIHKSSYISKIPNAIKTELKDPTRVY